MPTPCSAARSARACWSAAELSTPYDSTMYVGIGPPRDGSVSTTATVSIEGSRGMPRTGAIDRLGRLVRSDLGRGTHLRRELGSWALPRCPATGRVDDERRVGLPNPSHLG